ncbi:MAG: glycosyltransferase family 39 protein [Anaerolineaceae bacterium]|jgi:hypothetical protein
MKKSYQNLLENKFLGKIFVFLFFLVISFQTLSDSNPGLNPPGRDGGFFLYVGKALRSGATLYKDIWDSKGPIIFWINALGVGSDFSRWGLYLIQILFSFAALVLIYFSLKKVYSPMTAFVSIILGSYLLKLVIGPGNSTEEFSLLFTWIAVFAFVIFINDPKKSFWSFFLIGASLLINFLLRANNIGTVSMVLLSGLIFAFTKRKEISFWKPIVFTLAGVFAVAIPVSLYFIINGTFSSMIDAAFIYNFFYSTARGQAFSNSLQPAIKLFSWWFYILGFVWLVSIAFFIRNLFKKQFSSFLLLTILAFPAEILMSSISGRGFTHYFICWIPALTLLSAFGFSIVQQEVISAHFSELVEKKHAVLASLILLIVAIIPCFQASYDSIRYIRSSILYPEWTNDYVEPTARVISDLTNEQDKVLVFGGQAGINMMAKRDSINAALFYPTINNSEIGIRVQEQFLETLIAEKPLLIIDGHTHLIQHLPAIDPKDRANQSFTTNFSENLEEVLQWINENYERHDEADGYIIYRYVGQKNKP